MQIDPHGPEGLRISKVCISGKYNLRLSPGAWPTGVFCMRNVIVYAKTTFLVYKLRKSSLFRYILCLFRYIAYCLLPMPGWMHSAAWMHTASECILPLNAFGRRMHSARGGSPAGPGPLCGAPPPRPLGPATRGPMAWVREYIGNQ